MWHIQCCLCYLWNYFCFIGPLPRSLGALRGLRTLILSNNEFEGWFIDFMFAIAWAKETIMEFVSDLSCCYSLLSAVEFKSLFFAQENGPWNWWCQSANCCTQKTNRSISSCRKILRCPRIWPNWIQKLEIWPFQDADLQVRALHYLERLFVHRCPFFML